MPHRYVFVYGSLKSGFHNHSLIQAQLYMGEAVTSEPYHLITGPGFPYLLKNITGQPKKPIVGELYSVDETAFADIDELEGNGVFYQRQQIEVQLNGNVIQDVWAYFLPENRFMHHSSATDLMVMSDHRGYYWSQR